MKTTTLIISLALVAVVIAFFIFYPINLENLTSNKKNTESSGGEIIDSEQDDNLPQEEIPENNNNKDESSGSNGNAGGGASSSQSKCQQTQISYALKNFIKKSECLSYSNEICTNKILNCSVEAHNLDGSVSGEFKIKIIIKNINTQETIQEDVLSEVISPQSFKKFEKVLIFESQVEDGEANKEYSCSFFTLEIPKKESC